MGDPIVTVAVIGFVGVLVTAIIGVWAGYVARPKIDKRNGNPGNRETLYPAAASAVKDVRRDVSDVKTEMRGCHTRLEGAIATQAAATQAHTTALNSQTGLLVNIKETLERIERQRA